MWIRRRMEDDEILKLAKNIVEEGFDYTYPCDFIGNYDSYLNEIIYGSAQTLINSFDELYKSDDDRHILESFVYKFIELKFGKYIKEVYDWYILHECDDSVNESFINELDRDWMDDEHDEKYEKIKGGIIKGVKRMMKSYGENEDRINIYGENKKRLMSYNKNIGELFYDRSIDDVMEKILPHPIWYVNGKYVISDVFESYFPDKTVKRCVSANMS